MAEILSQAEINALLVALTNQEEGAALLQDVQANPATAEAIEALAASYQVAVTRNAPKRVAPAPTAIPTVAQEPTTGQANETPPAPIALPPMRTNGADTIGQFQPYQELLGYVIQLNLDLRKMESRVPKATYEAVERACARAQESLIALVDAWTTQHVALSVLPLAFVPGSAPDDRQEARVLRQ